MEFFLVSQPPVPASSIIYFSTDPDPNYFLQPITMELLFPDTPELKITFSRSLVTKRICRVFFTPLNQTLSTAYSKIPFSKKS